MVMYVNIGENRLMQVSEWGLQGLVLVASNRYDTHIMSKLLAVVTKKKKFNQNRHI